MTTKLLLCVLFSTLLYWSNDAKPYQRHHKRNSHLHKIKRDVLRASLIQTADNSGKRSDIEYGSDEASVINPDQGASTNHVPKAFMDMTQEQRALSPEQTKDLMEKTYQQYANVSPQELDDAYKFVNGGQFDHGQRSYESPQASTNGIAEYEHAPTYVNPPPGGKIDEEEHQDDYSQNHYAQRSDLLPSPSKVSSEYSYPTYSGPKGFVEPIEMLNPNAIEKGISIGSQSGTPQTDFSSNNINDYGNAGFPAEEGSKKSGVPSQMSHIPPNASHPAGNHTHLTENEKIYHHDNDSDYSAVSRYPPYITSSRKVVYGPPAPNDTKLPNAQNGHYVENAAITEEPTDVEKIFLQNNKLVDDYAAVKKYPAYAAVSNQNIAGPRNDSSAATYQQSNHSSNQQGYNNQQLQQLQQLQQQSNVGLVNYNTTYQPIVQQPAMPVGNISQPLTPTAQNSQQPIVYTTNNSVTPVTNNNSEIWKPSYDPFHALTKVIPDITQIASPGSETSPTPMLPASQENIKITTPDQSRMNEPKPQEIKFMVDPLTGKKVSPTESNATKLIYEPSQVIAQVGSGGEAQTKDLEKSSRPITSSQYPVTLITLAQDLQKQRDKPKCEKKNCTKNTTETETKKDDPRCKSYTLEICYQPWMQNHCPSMCNNATEIVGVAAAVPATQSVASQSTVGTTTPQPMTNQAQNQIDAQIINNANNGSCPYKGNKYRLGESFDKTPCSTCLCEDDGLNCYDKPNCQQTKETSQSCQNPSFGGNSNGSCCVFPFDYNGQPQHVCLLQPGQGYWCATTGNYDQDNQWGRCGECTLPPCPSVTTTAAPTPVTTTTQRSTTSAPTTTMVAPIVCERWGNWTECDVTCGGGTQMRYRHCKGKGEPYLEEDKNSCNVVACPTTTIAPVVKCKNYSLWSECSKSCGFGERYRSVECFVGDEKKSYNETKQCYLKDCPPVCDPWSKYSKCSKSCGGGQQIHKRNCSVTDNINTDIIEFAESNLCNMEPCPTEWTSWSNWSECTVTCNGGEQLRHRIGTWEDLGRVISVPQLENQVCNTQECPPRCYEWSSWTECSKTCAGGYTERQRNCVVDKKINGTITETAYVEEEDGLCNNISCIPPYCGQWSAFTDCSSTCDGGIQHRWRTCGGVFEEENITCSEQPCVTTCGEWGEWSGCSATCNGMQTRIHHCKNGTHESDELQARPCNTNPCPTPTPITTTTTQATTFVSTQQTTTSTIITTTTATPTTTTTTTTTAPPSNCTEWSQWTECTRSCGSGYQERYRTCQTLAQEVESRQCNAQVCPTTPTIPVPECIVAYFSFDNVDTEKKQIFDEGPFHNHASYDGDISFMSGNYTCGNATDIKDGGEIYFNGSTFQNIPSQSVTIAAWIYAYSTLHRQSLFSTKAAGSTGDNYHLELEAGKIRWMHNDVYGKTTFWAVSDAIVADNDWVHIAVTYNSSNGMAQIFVNAVENTKFQGQGPLTVNWEMFAGIAGPIYTERFQGQIDELYIYNCSLVDEQIHEVADTCRTYTGEGCPSPLLGVCPPCANCIATTPTTIPITTTTEVPPLNGGWSDWTEWSLCSTSCDDGIKTRTRECDKPEPQFGGMECVDQAGFGNDTETTSCNEGHCPAPGGWCEWSSWSECNVGCGWGEKTHNRECSCPQPQYGGAECYGPPKEKAECFTKNCPINGNYTNWSSWSSCSATCSNGSQVRIRECANPVPKYGGSDCRNLGESEEVQSCFNIADCPIDGDWGGWSTWSECSRTCGDGVRMQNRTCSNPAAAVGGKDCVGNHTKSLPCKHADCCDIPYKSLGCFKDAGQEPHLLPELLFTDRDPQSQAYTGKPVHGVDFQGYVADLICRCAKAAKNKRFTHFSIQDFGECLSGSNVATTYDNYGREMRLSFRPASRPWLGCMDVDHDACSADSLTCVGMENTNYVYGLENVTSVDGGYSGWSIWSECSKSCGLGEHYRTRTCTNPKPTFGGKNCSHLGDEEELVNCTLGDCPVDGQWGSWSTYSECSVSCGEGTHQKERNCSNPSPSNGGLDCVGNNTFIQPCEIQPCASVRIWSYWSTWSECDVTCGDGKQYRTHTSSTNEGVPPCEGIAEEIQPCKSALKCSIDGHYTDWSSWSVCSATCGSGVKYSHRNCTNPEPQFGGRDCISQGLGAATRELVCNSACCPVHGNLSEWSGWSACDVTCGTGEQFRVRKCDSPAPQCGGRSCGAIGSLVESQSCAATIMCPIDGNWTQFGNWSACSKTCGYGGVEIRQRACTNPIPQFNGKFCFGDNTESKNCAREESCCKIPLKNLGCFNDVSNVAVSKPLPELLFDDQENIDLENWNDYLDELVCRCAAAALEFKYTHFSIQSLGQCYSGPNVQDTYNRYGPSDNCVTIGGNPSGNKFQECLENGYPCAGGDRTNYIYGLENVPPVDGNYTNWSQWSNCNVECGQGTKSRHRTCTNPSPLRGGKTCEEQNLGDEEETGTCEKPRCPVNCNWTVWSAWSPCDATCGDAIRTKTRSPTNPAAAYGGLNCTGEAIRNEPCDLLGCPVHGNYSNWQDWSACSVTCGNATKTRLRTCNNPAPSNGGNGCGVLGPSTERKPCELEACPVKGKWCAWSTWSMCSKTCGIGSINRNRVCECPAPLQRGAPCKGVNEECKDCNNTGCPVDGHYSQWTSWTNCDHTCGNGTKSRSRSCSNPTPVFGGLTCIQQSLGESEEILHCNLQECPTHGNWSAWTEWSTCSLTCGEGRQNRKRICSNPEPENGGEACFGNSTEARHCKMGECCETEHRPLGCYQDIQTGQKAFPEMLNTRKELITLLPWEDILSSIICDCAQEVKAKNYTHFGIKNYAECWSGPDVQNTYNNYGISNQCLSMIPLSTNEVLNNTYDYPTPNPSTYEPCQQGSLQCAGPLGSVYVYSVENVSVVDGNYNNWSEWGPCSRTCGGGIRTASRACNNPFPSFGGSDCAALGDSVKTELCNNIPCAVNGSWSSWSSWTQCSVSCGVGLVKRVRSCANPQPSSGGISCVTGNGTFAELQEETEVCNTTACPVPDNKCSFPWGEWSTCSATCGNGQKQRARNCTLTNAVDKTCPCPKVETKVCNLLPCPINGQWGSWSSFSPCSTTCAIGSKSRTRLCDSPSPQFNGKTCTGSPSETDKCNENVPCPVNGNYTHWSAWEACDQSCGNGTRVRSRSCNNPAPKNGGLSCIAQSLGNETDTEKCNLTPCPIDCEWSEWSTWGACSAVSGYGVETRFRKEEPTAAYGGRNCSGESSEQNKCYAEFCKTKYSRIGCFQDKNENLRALPEVLFNKSDEAHNSYSTWDNYLADLVCNCAEETMKQRYTHFALQDLGVCVSGPNVAQAFNKDGPSSNCVANLPEFPSLKNNSYLQCQPEDQRCAGANENTNFVYGLNVTAVDCGYTMWSAWSECSKTCGLGTKVRTRSPTNPPASFGGRNCSVIGAPTDSDVCPNISCPVDGKWSSWSSFGACSVSCGKGQGVRIRSRECNNPPPQHGSLECLGNSTQSEICGEECPIDGMWGEWSSYSHCSVSIGVGTKQRNRTCDNPAAAHGGKPCVGSNIESDSCETIRPPTLGPWSEWSECDVTCGTGSRSRSRTCLSGNCTADLIETEVCDNGPCPKACQNVVDLGFLVDFSKCVVDFFPTHTKQFIVDTAMLFDVSKDGSHFAYLPYSTVPGNNYIDNNNWFNNGLIVTINPGDQTNQRKYLESVIREEPEAKDPRYKNKGNSYLNRGLMAAADEMFTAEKGMRLDVRHVLIVISDGAQDSIEFQNYPSEINLTAAANVVKAKGIQVLAVAIGDDVKMDNLLRVASDPQFIFNASSFNKLNEIIIDVVENACERPHWGQWGSWTSCSATCGDGLRERVRQCEGGKKGEGLCVPASAESEEENCNNGPCITIPACNNAVDIGFIADFSSSTTLTDDQLLATIKTFITDVMSPFDVSISGSHFSYIPFSTFPGDYSPNQWFNNSVVASITVGNKTAQNLYFDSVIQKDPPVAGHESGLTFLNKALELANNKMFSEEYGMRMDKKKMLVLISDGKETPPLPDQTSTDVPLRAIKTKGVEILSVAVGSKINWMNVQKYVTKQANIFNMTAYDELKSRLGDIVSNICAVQAQWGSWGSWSGCSVTCGNGTRNRNRTCQSGKLGEGLCSPATAAMETETCSKGLCIEPCYGVIDLGIISDNSDSTNNGDLRFAEIKDLIISLAGVFDISKYNAHFSYIPYSTFPGDYSENQWFNNSIVTSIEAGDKTAQQKFLTDVIKREPEEQDGMIRGLRTKTYVAIQLAVEKMFSEAYGMRKDVKRVLILITDGKEDAPSITVNELLKLKKLDVEVIPVAIGDDINSQNLKDYAGSDNNVYEVSDFVEIKLKMADLVTEICQGSSTVSTTVAPQTSATISTTPALFFCTVAIDIVFVVDASKSITPHWTIVKEFLKNVIGRFDVSADKTNVAVILYSSTPEQHIKFEYGKDKAMLQAQIGQLEIIGTSTRTDLALDSVLGVFATGRPDVNDVAVLLTDGKTDVGSNDVGLAAKSIKDSGVYVISVGLGNDTSSEELLKIASEDRAVFTVYDYGKIYSFINDISQEMCSGSTKVPATTVATSTVATTQAATTLVKTMASTTPVATTQTTTTLAITTTIALTTPAGPYRCNLPIDIILLVDGSSSIGGNWPNVKTFLKSLVSRFEISPEKANFALVMYSSTTELSITLTDGQDKDYLEFQIDELELLMGSTRIDLALNFVLARVLQPGHGDRTDVNDVVVLITDGKTDADSEDLGEAAKPLKDRGIHLISVGFGNDTSFNELQRVATDSQSVYLIEDYAKIADHIDSIAKGICDGSVKNVVRSSGTQQFNHYSCEPIIVYSFDATCDATIYDESRKGNDATASGEYGFDETTNKCKRKLMLSTDGTVTIDGANVHGKPVDGVTIAVWLNLYGDGKTHPVFSVINSHGESQYLLEIYPQGNVKFLLKFGNETVYGVITSDNVFKFSDWIHIAVTYSMTSNKGSVYINGNALEASKLKKVAKRETQLLAGDWGGFVGIGKERSNSNYKQLMGAVDEFFLFPCALPADHIKRIKDFCDRYEPRVRAYPGTRYEIYERPTSVNVDDLKTELAAKKPVLSKVLDIFEAPTFTSIEPSMTTDIGSGLFAARLSGYFVPPISAEYTLKIDANEQGALLLNAEKPSLQSDVVLQSKVKGPPKTVQSSDYKVKLRAGIRYYIEVYQLSNDKMNTLKLGFDVQCDAVKKSIFSESPVTKINTVYDIPRNCSDIRDRVNGAPDDEYTMRLHAKCQAINIYCHNMVGAEQQTSEIEYLTLNKGPEDNFALYHRSRLVNFKTCSGPEIATPPETDKFWGQTWFKRVRVNPTNMLIARDDFTHAYKIGNNVKYGTAGDCYSKSKEDCRKGRFKINLGGTDMKIVGKRKWVSTGSPTNLKERMVKFHNSPDWKVVSAYCGGSCSECEPEEGHVRLQPDICSADANLEQTSKKTSEKHKRNAWSFW